MMYTSLVLGGTFDHFHVGHQKLIDRALALSTHVVLGLTESNMHGEKAWSGSLLPYAVRKSEIEVYLKKCGRLSDVTIIPIHDVYGTTLTDRSLQAIVVTEHSRAGADVINAGRKERGLSELQICMCDLMLDASGVVVSSTRIRNGQVNRLGLVYQTVFKETISFDEVTKHALRSPLGNVYSDWSQVLPAKTAILVGDVVTKTAIEQGLLFSSAWIDGISKRQAFEFLVSHPYQLHQTGLQNEPGTIDRTVAHYMSSHVIGNRAVYEIQGEEDLLTLVAILLAPLGAQVMYGNPFGGGGIVVVQVTEEKKAQIHGKIKDLCPIV